MKNVTHIVLDGGRSVVDEGIWSTCNDSIRVYYQSGRDMLVDAYVIECDADKGRGSAFLRCRRHVV